MKMKKISKKYQSIIKDLIRKGLNFKAIIIISFFIIFSLSYALAWTSPSITPPGGNTDQPLNVGATTQYKAGALEIVNDFKTKTYTYLATLAGNVGIGTTTPPEKLTLAGGNFLVTTGNIDAPTASIGNISASQISVTENMDIGNNLHIGNGLNVGPGGIKADGPIAASSLDVLRYIKAIPGAAPADCVSENKGEIYYNNTLNAPCFCDGVDWVKFNDHSFCSS